MELENYLPLSLKNPKEQKYIIAEIEAEQALVAINREIIERFEKKIQAKLNEIWDCGS